MPALQVRDFPEDLYEELRAYAQRQHRSIAQQTIVAVQDYLAEKEKGGGPAKSSEHIDNRERRRKVIERINSLPPFEVPEGFPTPQEIIRELRDSR